jgi:hypothetical protein
MYVVIQGGVRYHEGYWKPAPVAASTGSKAGAHPVVHAKPAD